MRDALEQFILILLVLFASLAETRAFVPTWFRTPAGHARVGLRLAFFITLP